MKVTIYELLGLIKEGKAPKKIIYEDKVYQKGEYSNNVFYFCDEFEERINLTHFNNLEDEIEILDEEDEFIDIEEFKSFITNVGAVNESNIEEYIHILFKQQTALINNQKKIINKLKEEGK